MGDRLSECNEKLATAEISPKWTMPLKNWGKVLGELEIMYPDRLN